MTKSEKLLENLLELIPHTLYIDITGCYRLKVQPNWKAEPQKNKNQHILFVKSGYGEYIFGQKKIPLEPGRLVFISSHCIHHAWHDKDNPLVITGLRFELLSAATDLPYQPEPFYLSVKINNIPYYDQIFASINQSFFLTNKPSHQLACNNLISYLLAEILNLQQHTHEDLKHHKIDRVRRYMMDDINGKYTIEELAAKVDLSPRHLSTCFKSKYGITPKQYQLQLRMSYAKFLLETTSMTISSISTAIGYSDPFVFSRQFKNHYGLPPSKIR
ncbi:MAG: AraC family transcriptional regulator [Vallitalea sp.]|jgi:AraC-like DNA-binding protein|nr:AraC family transcriptional regulator [Vallitalea sp.]